MSRPLPTLMYSWGAGREGAGKRGCAGNGWQHAPTSVLGRHSPACPRPVSRLPHAPPAAPLPAGHLELDGAGALHVVVPRKHVLADVEGAAGQ